MLVELDTSLRTVDPSETWAYLKTFWRHFGIVRVTNITRLDRIGIPVYAAIRPRAHDLSLSVSSGKALDAVHARVGALCEAVELTCAEHDPHRDSIATLKVCDVGRGSDLDIYDFGVFAEFVKRVNPRTPIDALRVRDLNSDTERIIPASLVLFPYEDHSSGARLFGQSTNGLAGGNSVSEATLHALLELLERDVLSFVNAGAPQQRVTDISDPTWQHVVQQIESAGLRIRLCYCDNAFSLPMFICYITETDYSNAVVLSRGQGLHFSRRIAMLRAVTEAIQSRLTHIHGARDDILRRYAKFQRLGRQEELCQLQNVESFLEAAPLIAYADTTHHEIPRPFHNTTGALVQQLLERLRACGIHDVYVYDLTKFTTSYHVVKVVVPGLEFFSKEHPRVGKRLLHWANGRH